MKRSETYRLIEYPSAGATYNRPEYGVYEYGVYPRSSVLAGQQSRKFLNSFDTLEEAQAAFPDAEWNGGGCHYQPPSLGHLPDEDGIVDYRFSYDSWDDPRFW